MCTRNGQLIPEYYEDRVFTIPYRIKADRILEPVEGDEGVPSVKMKTNVGAAAPTSSAAPLDASSILTQSEPGPDMVIDQTTVEGAPNAP